MNRKSLLNTLELVKPALADENLVPIFQCFCFTGNTVYAYKDSLGIVAPCDTGTAFACNGRTLMDLLRSSQAKELELELDDENVMMKAGRSRMKLPYSSDEDFLFEEPEDQEWQIMLDINGDILRGLELCLVTSTNDSTMPAFQGITIRSGAERALYSCDGDALSKYQLPGQDDDPDVDLSYLMPNSFCESLLRTCEKTGYNAGQLYVNDEWVIAELGNDIKIYGRIVEIAEPFDYEGQLQKAVQNITDYVDVPEGYASALNRARVVADSEGKATKIVVEKNILKLTTETHIGNVVDKIKFKHKDVKASIAAKEIHRALAVCDEMAIDPNCTAYRQGDEFLLVMGNYNE